jgi:hypothetical protein
MIQAAHDAPALRCAPIRHAVLKKGSGCYIDTLPVLVVRKVSNDPSGTGHASPERLSCPLLPPPLALRPVECNPAGGGMGGAVARPKRRSANPRRHVPGPRPLRSRLPRRARPRVTGGDPAAPGRLPATPQPPHEPRPSLRFGSRRRVGVSAPLRSGLRLRSLRSLRPGATARRS